MDNNTNLVEKQNYAIFTVCNLAYLPKALVLAESVLKYNGTRLKIYLFDKKVDNDLSNIEAELYWMEEMNVPNYNQLAFKYDIIEFSTSLKPFITINLLREFKNVIFLDPDTCLFHSIQPILNDLNSHSIILTPHYTTPQSDDISESDTGMMRFGSFNLGFYAIRKSDQSVAFLKWWSKRCIDLCFMESQLGLSTDQKWVSIAPCLFQDIKISFNLGYNVAAWNSWERKITKREDGSLYVNDTFPLVFFHFSNFDTDDPGYLNKRSFYEKGILREDYLELGLEYLKNHNKKYLDYKHLQTIRYSYDYMSNGDYISPTLRLAYASVLNNFIDCTNPFDSDGVVANFAKKNHLITKNFKRSEYIKAALHGGNKFYRQITFVNLVLKSALIILGPNKFYLLSRGLVYFSSLRLNRNLWKL